METDAKDFAEIRHQPDFVDQSLLIETVLSVHERIILRAPRRSGKSVNISMLKRFFEILPDQEALQANRKLFEGLEIDKNKSIMNEHFGKYPVIFLDFDKDRPIDSYNDAFEFFRYILHKAYKSHAYLQNSTKIEDEEKPNFDGWFDESKYCTLYTEEEHVYAGYRKLTEYLQIHYYEKVYLLVDNYDSMWSSCVKDVNGTKKLSPSDENRLKDILTFYTNLLQWITVHNGYVGRAILTGYYPLQPISYTWIHGDDLQHIMDFDCRESPEFSKFYGYYPD